MNPASTTAIKNASYEFSFKIAAATIDVKPAAGPLTLSGDPLKNPTTIPPTTPAMIPEKRGAVEPKAIPRQSGRATR